jgi:hypothetical protein
MPPRSRSVSESKFAKGMDCRPGIEGEGLQTFRELVNCVVAEDGTLETRNPCRQMSGLLSALAQGLILNGGQEYTFARRGDSITHTGDVASFVTTLYFDPPENSLATWTLVAYEVFQNQVVAYIRHTFPGVTITSRLYFHVWDSRTNNPTYVDDPAAPWDWGPAGFPINAYGSGTGSGGAWQTFSPIMEPAAEKVWSSRVDRNVGFGGIARPRIWNSRSAADIEKTGAMYYFTVPNTGTFTTYAFPEAYADFADYQKFAGYVLEKLNTDGSWTKIPEVFGLPAAGQWQLISASRPWSTLGISAIYANGLTADTLIRIRILMTPEVDIVTGGTMTPASETYRGDGSTVQWPSTIPFAAFTSYQVRVNNSLKASPDYYTATNNLGFARIDFKDFAQVTDGKLTAGAITAGTGYTSFPAIALVGGSGGSGGAAAVTSLKAVSAGIAAGGGGYTNGDILTLTTDTGTQATFTATVAAGIVTAVTVLSGGVLTAVAANPHATTGGTGAGCTLTVQYGIGTVTVTPGQGYVTAPTTNVTGGGGAGGALVLTLLAPVGQTGITYAAATDGDFGRLSVYFNGAKQVEGVGYNLVNNAGTAYVVPTTGLAIGTTLNARLVVPLDTLIEFIAPSVVLAAGTVRYEQAIQNSSAVLVSSLAPSSTYYVAATANGVIGYKLTSSPWTGLERYQLRIVGTVTTDGAGAVSATTAFQYGSDALTTWYVARHQLNLDYYAGENEGGFINSGTHDNSGTNVTGMVAVKNRLAIFYAQSTQLWQVDPAPINCAYIDKFLFGSRYEGVNFYNRPLIYTQKGFRAFDLQGLNFQSLEDVNIGEPIQQLGKFTLTASTFWPWRGSYIAAATLTGTAAYAAFAKLPANSIFWQDTIQCFAYLTFSKESEISAWAILTVAGLTAVETMIADDNRVYCLQGNQIWYFDDNISAFTDGLNGVSQPTGAAAWHLVPMGGDTKSVRLLHLDIIKDGKAQFNTSTMPWNASRETPGPIVSATTVGRLRVPLRSTGRAASLRLLTNDPAGVVVQSVSIEFMPLGR